ncbi:OmpA family protein [Sphingomonas sp. CBMAI 2297]|uniref:OmpA family protein n=1 Tax=Sphingomonas sp. CBMAI 2297 TaxID=2991720 RepID=UPI0024573653|nr:OmpA family protein [Sphingomonas sp. CBMAI 2297]MDH4742714.1 OmpA family protein [Sphingomonas sp. CBMAI 2297]
MKLAGYGPLLALLALLLAGCQASMRPKPLWTAPQIEAMRAAGFVQTDRGWELSVADRLLFASDESRVDEKQAVVIARIASNLQAVEIRHATIEGHADITGTRHHNLVLSGQRARAVANVFVGAGFDRDNIRAEGLGDRYPIEDNRTAEGRQENRRVVILLTAP